MSDYHTLTVPERQILRNQIAIIAALSRVLSGESNNRDQRIELHKIIVETENLLTHGSAEKEGGK